MSEFESAGASNRALMAIIVIVIIGVAGVGFVMLGGLGPTTTTTTTPTTTPTGSTTTTTTTEPTEGVLTIVTRHDITIHNVYEPAFLATDYAQNNGITDILWKTPSEAFWDDLIILGQADVLWGGGPTLFDQLMRDDHLEPLISPKMQTVADRVNDTIAGSAMKRNNSADQLVWIAAAISSFGFTVNHDFLDDYSLPTPSSWTDLADPIYGSLLKAIPTIAMGNAPDTTSNTKIYHIITQGLGWQQGWTTMARMAGSANIYGGSVETQTAAESGQVGIAMSIDFYGYGTQFRNPDCEYIVPDGESIVNGDPIAIADTSSHKDWAEAFVDFVLTPAGQALWFDDSIRRMPVMREAFYEPGAPTDLYTAFNNTLENVGIEFDDTLELEINSAFIHYWSAVFNDAHTELVDCWYAILDAYDDGRINLAELNAYANQMGAMLTVQDPDTLTMEEFTIEYATSINYKMIYDAGFLSDIKDAWTAEAKAQYVLVMNAANAET